MMDLDCMIAAVSTGRRSTGDEGDALANIVDKHLKTREVA